MQGVRAIKKVDTERFVEINSKAERIAGLQQRLLSAKGQEDSVLKELIQTVHEQERRISTLEKQLKPQN